MRRILVPVVGWSLLIAACGAATTDISSSLTSLPSAASTPLGPATTAPPAVTISPVTTAPTMPSAITTSTNVAAVTTSTRRSPPKGQTELTIDLRSYGVGPVSFGDPVDEVVARLVGMLGNPDVDDQNEWTDSIGIHNGLPANHSFRFVFWKDIGLAIVTSDGVSWPDGRQEPVLIRWSYFLPTPEPPFRLVTDEGIGVDSTAFELKETYGDLLTIREDEFDGWQASLPEPFPDTIPTLSGIVFNLTGAPTDSESVVAYMWAGSAQAP